MDLREFRETVLRLDHPETLLILADKYLTDMEAKGDSFILPKEHVAVKPVLEFYAGDLEGWVKFVAGIRDRLPVSGRKFHPEVHMLYRTLEIRLTQQQRRERLSRAVEVAVKKRLIPNDYEEKMRYARRCTKEWQLRKTRLLDALRAGSKQNRVSVAERDSVLRDFWLNIDAEIENGELPKP